MDKMSLIVFEQTGHVLAAFTRTADPEGAVEPADVVGEGLYLRDPDSGGRLVIVEPQHLAVETVDRLDRVLLVPHAYVLVDGVPEEQSVHGAAPVTLSGTEITITLPGSATEDLEAWVQVQTGSQPILCKVEIASGDGTNPPGSELLALSPGDYGVLALVPGYRAFTGTVGV